MNDWVYPRLSYGAALVRVRELEVAYRHRGVSALSELAASSYASASPTPTGGRIAGERKISEVRTAVLHDMETWVVQGEVPRSKAAAFDRVLGASLHSHLQIMQSDAAHDETWSFLSLIVFPDLSVMRFPDMHTDRMVGTDRNSLRRCWFRHHVLGDLMLAQARPLGEDELVGLFERTALARNRRLAKALARRVLNYSGSGRSDWARQLYVNTTYATGPRILDILSDGELDDLVAGCEPTR